MVNAGREVVTDVAEAFGFQATVGDKDRARSGNLNNAVLGALFGPVAFLGSFIVSQAIKDFGRSEIAHYRQKAFGSKGIAHQLFVMLLGGLLTWNPSLQDRSMHCCVRVSFVMCRGAEVCRVVVAWAALPQGGAAIA